MKKSFIYGSTMLAIALALGNPSATYAGEQTMLKLMKVLRDNRTLTQEQYEMLVKAAEAPDNQSAPSKERDKEVKVSSKGGVKLKTSDGEFEAKLGGRIMVDTAFYDDDKSDLSDGTEFRRTRLHFKGKVHKDWKFKSQIDFADNEVDIKDTWIGYYGLKPFNIQVGQIKPPFSLEHMGSSKYTTFMEKALPMAIPKLHDYGIGINMNTYGDNWSLSAAVYGEEATAGGDDDEEFGVSGRLTAAPFMEDGFLLHLGASAGLLKPNENTVRFRASPESHLAPKFLDVRETVVNADAKEEDADITGVDSVKRYGLEAAAVWGPLSLQGEYLVANMDRSTGNNVRFDGYYVFGSWFITGESRPYETDEGIFGRVKPKSNFSLKRGGLGAFELATRYSQLDLNDPSAGVTGGENDKSAGVTGGEEDNITLGLNWYFNPQVRLMANYISIDTDENAGDNDPKVYQMRMQIDF